MSRTPHTDDGHPVKAAKGRPPKPAMTDAEFEAVKGLLSLPRGTHGSSLDRAALEISLMRGYHQVNDPRTRKSREVSGRWVGLQLAKRGIPGKRGLREKFGANSRKHEVGTNSQAPYDTGTRTVHKSPPVDERPSEPASQPFTLGVESERKGVA